MSASNEEESLGSGADMSEYAYGAFSGYGVEIEHMIVKADTLDVLPVADQLLDLVGGAEDMDVPRGSAAWSNELALHVIEMKTAGPTRDLVAARDLFRGEVNAINALLEGLGGRLLPTGMHPWMDPEKETRLWPHQNDVIYKAFDRIFGCSGHGWSNLQSVHINFPFQSEDEFLRVHAACRFVLPLLPTLAASSPYMDGVRAPGLDGRLLAYQKNCARVPSVTGRVIPEALASSTEYRAMLSGIYKDLAPYDPDEILAEEWVNARGCIARFDRGAVEIRVIDTQECPEQDLAIVSLVTQLVKDLAEGRHQLSAKELLAWSTDELAAIFSGSVTEGRSCRIMGASGPRTLSYSGVFGSQAATLGELASDLVERYAAPEFAAGLALIAAQGSLAERLVQRLGPSPSRGALGDVYRELSGCLSTGSPFSS